MERIKADIIEALKRKFDKKREFVDNKEYLNVIKDIIEKGDINSDCNDGDNQWKGEFDLLFDFLYDNASSISVFDEEHYNPIYVKYKNKLIELFEIHGQGCYRRIRVLNDEGLIKYHTDFEDIITYVEKGIKPERTEILDLLNLSLDSFGVISEGFNLEIDLDYVKGYLLRNLS